MYTTLSAFVVLGLSAITLAVPTFGRPSNDRAITARERAVVIDVLSNDSGIRNPKALRIRSQPTNGQATVVDGRIRYIPSPGFTGVDRFSYFVAGNRGGGSATVAVDVGESLVLRGRVIDAPIAYATVQASINGHNFAAQANASGNYSLEVISLGEGMVTLGAQGIGAQGFVRLLSVVGGFERLRAEAGSDAVLTRDENDQVQLTQLSTALAYLLQVANDGAAIANEAQLARARASFDSAALLQMAGAIKLAVDGEYPLPAGTPDTLALISDSQAYQQFVAAANADDPGALTDASLATLSDPEVVPNRPRQALLGSRFQFLTGADGDVRVGAIYAERLSLAADGTGDYVNIIGAGDTGMTWTFDSGTAGILLDTPRVSESLQFVNGVQIPVRTTLERLEAKLIYDGGTSGRDLLGLTTYSRRTYPDNPELPAEMLVNSGARTSFRDGVAEVPYLTNEFPSVRALDTHRPEIYPLTQAEPFLQGYALHRFDDGGTGQVLDDAQTFTWSLTNGRIRIAYADGESMTMIRLLRDSGKGEGVLSLYELPDGKRKAFYALSSVRDGSLAFDTVNLAFPWRTGFDVSNPGYDSGPDYGTYFALTGPGQTGELISVTRTGTSRAPLSWDLIGGVAVIRRYFDNTGVVPRCTPGVNGCVITQDRRWIPVSRDDDRIYVSEELRQRNNVTGSLELISQRANFYQIQTPPTL